MGRACRLSAVKTGQRLPFLYFLVAPKAILSFLFSYVTSIFIFRVGFSNVKAMDKTDEFVRILKMEMARFEPSKGKFIKEFSQKDYDELVDGWKIKVVRCSDKDQGWGWFHAYKQ